MKRILSIALCISLILTTSAILPQAAGTEYSASYYNMGDIDLDLRVTVFDATMLQRNIAKLDTLSELQLFIADVNRDKSADIFDVTQIQRCVAKMPYTFLIKSFYRYPLEIDRLYTYHPLGDDNTRTSYVGEQVSFRIELQYYPSYFYTNKYTVYIDDEQVQYRSTDQRFSYTFTQKGDHTVTVYGYDILGNTAVYSTVQHVIPITNPIVYEVTYHEEDHTVSVEAASGEAPLMYQYRFKNHMITPTNTPWEPTPSEAPTSKPTSPSVAVTPGEHGLFDLMTNWISDPVIVVPEDKLSRGGHYLVEVQVRDALGRLSVEKSIDFYYYP